MGVAGKMSCSHVLLLLSLLPAILAQDENPVACLESGACYQGSFYTTSSGVQYSSFQGIRYAESPTGSRRFLALEPHQPEEGLWDVSSEVLLVRSLARGRPGRLPLPQRLRPGNRRA